MTQKISLDGHNGIKTYAVRIPCGSVRNTSQITLPSHPIGIWSAVLQDCQTAVHLQSRTDEWENLMALQNNAETHQLPLPDALVCGTLKAFKAQSSAHISSLNSRAVFPFLAALVTCSAVSHPSSLTPNSVMSMLSIPAPFPMFCPKFALEQHI